MSRKNENKKGANGAGSIRKITTTRNGKEYTYWQGRYTEGYDACTGKQIQRSITGKTQKAVAQKPRQITAEIDAKTYVAPCKLSMSLNGWPFGHRTILLESRRLPHTFTSAPLSCILTRISVTSGLTH